MSAAGYVITAGVIAAANEAIFLPIEGKGTPLKNFNWKIVPATAILAMVLTGFEKVAPDFGNGLGIMVLLTVLVVPAGNAPSPLENLAAIVK